MEAYLSLFLLVFWVRNKDLHIALHLLKVRKGHLLGKDEIILSNILVPYSKLDLSFIMKDDIYILIELTGLFLLCFSPLLGLFHFHLQVWLAGPKCVGTSHQLELDIRDVDSLLLNKPALQGYSDITNLLALCVAQTDNSLAIFQFLELHTANS